MSERYEVLFIVRPDIGEAGMKEQVDRARQVLEQQGASEITVHDWGMRDLAYRIEGHTRGAYVLIEYESLPPAVRELERTLKLSDSILRYMSIRQTEGMAVPIGEGLSTDDVRPAATGAPAPPAESTAPPREASPSISSGEADAPPAEPREGEA